MSMMLLTTKQVKKILSSDIVSQMRVNATTIIPKNGKNAQKLILIKKEVFKNE